MSIYKIKPQFQKLISPIAIILYNGGVSATMINFMGLSFSIMAGALFFFPSTLSYSLIPLLFFLRIMSNALDGMVARLAKESSEWGEYLNELLDKISDALIFLLCTISDHGDIVLGICATTLVLLTSFTGTLSKTEHGKRIYSGIMGKPDRMFVMGLASVLYIFEVPYSWNIAYITVITGSLITMIIRITKAHKELSKWNS